MPIARRVVLLVVMLAAGGAALAGGYAKLAPYDGVRWTDGAPEVRIEKVWYGLVSIDGAKAADIVGFAQKTWPGKWRKRFEEDLVEVLSKLGKAPGRTVTLVLQPLDSGDPITRRDVPMTEENRKAIWRAAGERERGGGHSPPVDPRSHRRPVQRQHAQKADARFVYLQKRIEPDGDWGRQWLSAEGARADLDELEWLLEAVYSYLEMNEVDYRAALDTIRLGLQEGMPRGAFALQVQKLLCLFGDGHTRIRGLTSRVLPGPHLGLFFEHFGNALVVTKASGVRLSGHAFLSRIDGVPVGEWLAKARTIVAQGSPQLQRRWSARRLQHIGWLRQELGFAADPSVKLLLTGPQGKGGQELLVVLGDRSSSRRPPAVEGRRDGKVGVLTIREMSGDREDLETLRETMKGFRSTRGLVIDVRDNGGGSRDFLRTLLPYFMAPDEAPHVCNVAAYRLQQQKTRPEGFLDNRFLYPETASSWSEPERERIRAFAESFKPDWTLPAAKFSAWHYMLVGPKRQPAPYHYDKKVVVLQNEGCFSATDVFLGAFKGRPRVTLVGTKSGGGSGRSRSYRLRHSEVEVRLSSMASFTPWGQRYDGVGIAPDIVVEPTLEDLTTARDSQMQEALRVIGRRP